MKKLNNKSENNIKYKKKSNKYKKKYTQKITYNKNQTKYIYIKNNAGFGNKVFDLIFAIYLYNLYNTKTSNTKTSNTKPAHTKTSHKCIIHYVLVKSVHDKATDPTLDKIFPNVKLKIKFISDKTYATLSHNPLIKIKKIYNDNEMMQKLSTFPTYDDLSQYTKIDNNFRLVYEMYKTFSKQDKTIFTNMNTSLINKKDIEIMNKHINLIVNNKHNIHNIHKESIYNYVVVNIRYGDKIKIVKRDINTPKFDNFLIYTPQYYIDMITMFLDKDMPVVIITDSTHLVTKFIINSPELKNHKHYKNIILLDIHWITGFYILCHASHIVMSCSTFSMTASYFNEKSKCYIVLDNNANTNRLPEEYSIAPNWIISKNNTYLLNYDKQLLLSMV